MPATTHGGGDLEWFRALCRSHVQPIAAPETGAEAYVRSLRNRPRALRAEGIPLQLTFPSVTDTTVVAAAFNRGAPLRTDLLFTRTVAAAAGYDVPAAPSVLLSLPGGPGAVTAALGGLAPNSRYQFTLASYFQYTAAESAVRHYSPTDLRHYPTVYTLWTHGPAQMQFTAGRMVRFAGSAVNVVRPSLQPVGTAAVETEALVYYVLFTRAGEDAPAAVVGPITVATAYAPPTLPSGDYVAVIESVYTYNGAPDGTYASEPFEMTF